MYLKYEGYKPYLTFYPLERIPTSIFLIGCISKHFDQG